MSEGALVWIMSDGVLHDVLGTCRSGDGMFFVFEWSQHDPVKSFHFWCHQDAYQVDAVANEWTQERETWGAKLILGPRSLPVPPPVSSDERIFRQWWDWDLRPAVRHTVLRRPWKSVPA